MCGHPVEYIFCGISIVCLQKVNFQFRPDPNNMEGQQKFGLLLKKKSGNFGMKAKSIFDNSSDEEMQVKKAKPKIPQFKSSSSKSTKTEMDDPSIYEYDTVYDDMKAKQKEELRPKSKKESRYIESLLKAADKRKKQYQIRVEKKVQVEREKEGDKFKDKEAFVTSSYKKKMQEMEEEEERERRENLMNEMMDVTKQKDLSGFYRHFLKQTVGEEKVPVFGDKNFIKEEPVSDSEHDPVSNASKNNPSKDSKSKLSNQDADYSSEEEKSLGFESKYYEKQKYPEKQMLKKKHESLSLSSDDSDLREDKHKAKKRAKRDKNEKQLNTKKCSKFNTEHDPVSNDSKNNPSRDSRSSKLSSKDIDYTSEEEKSHESKYNQKQKYLKKKNESSSLSSDDSDLREDKHKVKKRTKTDKNEKQLNTEKSGSKFNTEHDPVSKDSKNNPSKDSRSKLSNQDADYSSEEEKSLGDESKYYEKQKYPEKQMLKKKYESSSVSSDDSDMREDKHMAKKRTKRDKNEQQLKTEKSGSKLKECSDKAKRSSTNVQEMVCRSNNLSDDNDLNCQETKVSHELSETEPKKRSIHEKRTVGAVFDEAQARYFMRLSARTS